MDTDKEAVGNICDSYSPCLGQQVMRTLPKIMVGVCTVTCGLALSRGVRRQNTAEKGHLGNVFLSEGLEFFHAQAGLA
jgi:hypothetical protein